MSSKQHDELDYCMPFHQAQTQAPALRQTFWTDKESVLCLSVLLCLLIPFWLCFVKLNTNTEPPQEVTQSILQAGNSMLLEEHFKSLVFGCACQWKAQANNV